MAKLKAPLMSLGASGALGKALVFFGWKGLDVVREYVVPANPQTTLQTTHRGYLTAAVAAIHAYQALATHPLDAADAIAYALLGSIYATPRTWFNVVVKQWIDQRVASLSPAVYCDGTTTPAAASLGVELWVNGVLNPTAGTFHYGTSKTALIYTQAATVAGNKLSATIAGLTADVKYYWQFRATAAAGTVGQRSGIYYGYPT